MEEFVSRKKQLYKAFLNNNKHNKHMASLFTDAPLSEARNSFQLEQNMVFQDVQGTIIQANCEALISIQDIANGQRINITYAQGNFSSLGAKENHTYQLMLKILGTDEKIGCDVSPNLNLDSVRAFLLNNQTISEFQFCLEDGEAIPINDEGDVEIQTALVEGELLLQVSDIQAKNQKFQSNVSHQSMIPLAIQQQESLRNISQRLYTDEKQAQQLTQMPPGSYFFEEEKAWKEKKDLPNRETDDRHQQKDKLKEESEYFKNLYEYASKMPEYYVKHFFLIQYYAFQLSQDQYQPDSSSHQKSLLYQIELLEKNLLKISWDDSYKQAVKDIKLMKQTLLSGGQIDYGIILKAASRRMKMGLPVNLEDIFSLIDKTTNSIQKLRNQDVILFIGGTGAGKSTSILYLAGNEMQEIYQNGLYHIDAVNSTNSDIISKASTQSVTRYIDCISVDPKNFDFLSEYDAVYLTDTAGFEDTQGVEVEVANCLGLAQAIKEARSVRIVVVLSYASQGDRFQGLKKIAKILVRLVKDVKSHLHAFEYLFTKYPKQHQSTVHESIVKIYTENDADVQNDEGFRQLLRDMGGKTIGNKACFAEPLNNDPYPLLKRLLAIDPIARPGEIFQFSIAPQSYLLLQKQLTQIQQEASQAIDDHKFDLAVYLISLVERIHRVLDVENLTQEFIDNIRVFSRQKIASFYHQAINCVNLRFQPEYPLTYDFLLQYDKDQEVMLRSNHLRLALDSSLPSHDDFENNMKLNAKLLLEELTKEQNILEGQAQVNFAKLYSLANWKQDSYANYYAQAQFGMETTIQQKVKHYKKCIDDLNFEDGMATMKDLHRIKSTLEEHMTEEALKTLKQENLQNYLIALLEQKVRSTQEHLEEVKDANTNNFNDVIQLIEKAKAAIQIDNLINIKNIQAVHDKLEDMILKKIESLSLQIKERMKYQPELHLSGVREHCLAIRTLRKIDGIENKSHKLYFQSIETLIDFIESTKRDLLFIITSSKDFQIVDVDEICNKMRILEQVKWINDFKVGLYDDMRLQISQKFFKSLHGLQKSFHQMNCSIENPQALIDVSSCLRSLIELQPIDQFFPNLADQTNDLKTKIAEMFAQAIEIQKLIYENNDEMLNLEKAEQAYLFFSYAEIHATQELKYLKIELEDKASLTAIKIKIEERMHKYVQNTFNQMKNAYSVIRLLETNKMEEFERHKQIVDQIFKTLKIVQDNRKHLLKQFFEKNDFILENQQALFKQLSQEIRNDMLNQLYEKQHDKFLSKLSYVKSLTELDKHLENPYFNLLYQDTYEKFNDQLPKDVQELDRKIKENDFIYVQCNISDFIGEDQKLKRKFEQIRQSFQFQIELIYAQTKSKAQACQNNSQDISFFSEIQDKLKILQHAESIKEPLQSVELSKKIKMMITDIYEMVWKGINEQKLRLEENIKKENFMESKKFINRLLMITEILVPQPFYAQNLKYLKTCKDQLAQIIQNKIVEFQNLSIKQLRTHRPDRFIQKLESDEEDFYAQEVDQINNILRAKFGNRITEILQDKNLSYMNQLKELSQLFRAIPYLHSSEKDSLTDDVEEAINQVKNHISDLSERISSSTADQNFENLKSIYEECTHTASTEQIKNQIKNTFHKKIQEQYFEIRDNSQSGRFMETFENAYKLLDLKNTYPDNFDSTPYINDVKAQIAKNITQHINVIKYFLDDQGKQSGICQLQTLENIDIIRKDRQNRLLSIQSVHQANEKNKGSINGYVLYIVECFKHDQFLEYFGSNFIEPLIYFIETFLQSASNLRASYVLEINDLENQAEKGILQLNQLLDKARNETDIIEELRRTTVFRKNKRLSIPQQYLQKVLDGKTYQEMQQELILRIEDIQQQVSAYVVYDEEIIKSQIKRETHFSDLNKKLRILNFSATLIEHIPDRIFCKSQEAILIVSSKVSELANKSFEIINNPNCDKKHFEQFQKYYKIFTSYNKIIDQKIKQTAIDDQLNKIESGVNEIIMTKQGAMLKDHQSPNQIAQELISLKEMSGNLEPFRDNINHGIDSTLQKLKENEIGNLLISNVGKILVGDQIGAIILKEHKAFSGVSISIFTKKFAINTIDYILQYMEGERLDKTKLKARYQDVMIEFERSINLYVRGKVKLGSDAISSLVNTIKLGFNRIDKSNLKLWGNEITERLPTLIGQLFALWTLLNSSYYFESLNLSDKESYLLQPHPGQIVSILRILCIGNEDEDTSFLQKMQQFFNFDGKWINNLVQIGTGEGKSVTLAVTSVILALLGIEAFCVCYSYSLCRRDYNMFANLFQQLGVESKIRYYTFSELCEYMINAGGNVRDGVNSMFLVGSIKAARNKQQSTALKVLLIDEVDVFFKKDFYGNIYQPQAMIQHSCISMFLDFLWHKKANITYSALISSQEYKTMVHMFQGWEQILEQAAKLLLQDIKNFEDHDFIIAEGKIGYQDQDKIKYNINYGYKTMFAYYLAADDGKVTQATLNTQKAIRLNCGGFSFAKIPGLFFKIVGVTGTLKNLSDNEKEIISKEYKISHSSFIPSAFGSSIRKFDLQNDFLVENEDDYFPKIAQEIYQRLNPLEGIKLAVLVFFESARKLEDFYQSQAFQRLRPDAHTLTEQDTDEDKITRIKLATVSGAVTLFTGSFGRGTDFISQDETVMINGGAQVIITFMPEEESEQVQLQGRTGRQGQSGRYCFILKDKDLEKYIGANYKLELQKNKRELYDHIIQKRDDFFKSNHLGNYKFLRESDKLHEESIQFRQALRNSEIQVVKQFLLSQNLGPSEQSQSAVCNVVLLMDATASMKSLIQKTKQTVHIMFERSRKVLEENKITPDCITMQMACYRNYNAYNKYILEYSPWENQPKNLKQFMDKVSASHGLQEEAVEIGLQHCIQQLSKPLSLVILIGDAPAQTFDQVKERRGANLGENYWRQTKFNIPYNFKEQIKLLNKNRVPIYAFYVAGCAEKSFTEIGNLSVNGKSAFLDVNSNLGADMLVDIVTTSILAMIGEKNNLGNDLVTFYEKMYPKSYS